MTDLTPAGTAGEPVYVCDLITTGACSPRCLLALGVEKDECRCSCRSKYHGVFASASVDDAWKAELYDVQQADARDAWDRLEARLDRILELLDGPVRPRGYTLTDMVGDLLDQHAALRITDAQLYARFAEITGIKHPSDTTKEPDD